ncbi:hypothetical protein BH24BAC1_BH24BAC1_20400 [soil metagenome]|jgi:hypothetical protein
MKKLLRNLLAFCLPLVLSSCEEGLFGPRRTNCLETEQVTNAGLLIQRIYERNRITEIQNVNRNGELQSFQEFTYDNDGRIVQSQNYNAQRNPTSLPLFITYNEKGKWAKTTSTNSAGVIFTSAASYNNQDQIIKYTSTTDRAGTITENYTIDYVWENGNNTLYTYVSPTQRAVVQYEFDLNQANMRRKDQEKTAFLSPSVAFNRNMLKRVTNTTTTGTTTATTVSDYTYEYNEQGYPVRLTRTANTNSGTPSTFVTDFSYDCN